MQASVYRCLPCWVELRTIGRMRRPLCPRCQGELIDVRDDAEERAG